MVEKGEGGAAKGSGNSLDYSSLSLTSLEPTEDLKPRLGAKKCRKSKNGLYMCNFLKLSNNDLLTATGLHVFAMQIIEQPEEKLTKLDLSANRLNEVPEELSKLPSIKVIYLHNNHIADLSASIKILKTLEGLYSLTLHTNPVDQRKSYKNKLISSLPKLRSLDFVNVSAADRRQLAELSKQPGSTRFKN